MSLKIINAGFLATLQDSGRHGYQHLGITTGGPMDEHAFAWANQLLENPRDAAALEITYGALTLEIHAPTCCALTGADLGARLNDIEIEPWRSYRLKPGDQLSFSSPRSGLRAYLAVRGGFRVAHRLGSCATVMREQLGGLCGLGAKLSRGDQIPFTPCSEAWQQQTPKALIPDYQSDLEVGLIPGYQYYYFPYQERLRLFTSEYSVSQNIDRMGYRLAGPAVHSNLDGIISEGIALGAVQIPKDGQPIVLMRDRQTIGGYPKIGCLSALGTGQLAQRAPGARIRFYPLALATAQAERQIFEQKRMLIDLQQRDQLKI